MAVQLRVGTLPKPASLSAEGGLPEVDDRRARLSRYARRRRIAKIKSALETALWVGGSAFLLFVAAGGLLSLR